MIMSKLDRRVVRFVPGDFNPVAPGEIRRGAMVAVPVVSVRSASTCGHTPPSIPELVAVRWARVDTAGDGIFATFDSPSGAIACAMAIRDAVQPLGLEIRAGIHVGECGMVAGKIGGIAVVTGGRVKDQAEADEVLVSQTVKDLVSGAGIQFADRGVYALKGIAGDWRLYAAEHGPASERDD